MFSQYLIEKSSLPLAMLSVECLILNERAKSSLPLAREMGNREWKMGKSKESRTVVHELHQLTRIKEQEQSF